MGTVLENERATATDGAIGLALGREQRPRRETTEPYQRLADDDRGTGGESTADLLGYFSLGLGFAELLAPTAMARLVGVKHPDDRTRTTMRLMGLREIGHGVAILSRQQPATAVWSRVAGDALDLAFLGRTLASDENDRGRALLATANVLAVAALDLMNARQLSRQPRTVATRRMDEGIIHTKRSVTVGKPVDEVYRFWRDFQNLPRFMRHLDSVTPLDERRSHWIARAPAGRRVEWDAELIADERNERIAWRSLPGADVYNAGTVRFRPAPGGRGTEVRVTLEYKPPLGKLGSKLAMLWGEEPGQQVARDLAHLKQVLETGDIVVSDATKRRGMHPGQPDGRPAELTSSGATR